MQYLSKRVLVLIVIFSIGAAIKAQSIFLSLDSCRALAIANNKGLLISNEKINAAHHTHKAAFTNFLPKLTAAGTYMRNQKELSILDDATKSSLPKMGTNASMSIQEMAKLHPELLPILEPLIGASQLLAPGLNDFGNSIVDALRTDTRNVYAATVTLTQPIYMGGKIRAYNKITKYAEQIAQQENNNMLQEVILNTDQIYWQVVSLANKKKLAEGYVKLLEKLNHDVDRMVAEGVATKANGLSVKVKLNEAEIALTKVEDGLSLSKMLLCQICGMEITNDITLADENLETLPTLIPSDNFNLQTAFENRPELRSLELANKIYKQKITVTRAEHLPSLALIGNYVVSNPSMFNGFETKFKGMWNVGVALKIPVFSWGEGYHKVKAAKAEKRIMEYKLQDAREKIELQVNQSSFKVKEAIKKLNRAKHNMAKANENLKYATLGFKEGLIPTSNVLEAQTAWLSAQSEKIDAQIDVKLTKLYLEKSLGVLK